MVTYDPSVIHQHARRLYDQALGIVVIYGIGFGLLGAVAAMGLGNLGGIEMLLAALTFALLGAAIGRARGFGLRLQAQTALCQVQIEMNTRQHSATTHAQTPWPNQPPNTPRVG